MFARGTLARRLFSAGHGVKTIGVVGAGQMGTGIGIVASRVAGINVRFIDPHADNITKSEGFVKNWCNKEIAKERMTEQEKAEVVNRISYSGSEQ